MQERYGRFIVGDVHGVILAGGISSRMGFPKALMPVGTSFFLLAIYDRIRAVEIEPVHIVINTGLRNSLEAQMFRFPEAEFHLNENPAKGQIHSLQLGLAAAKAGGAGAALVSLVDQPFILKKTFRAILAERGANPGKFIVPSVSGKHGHPFLIPAERFDAFLNAPESKTARDILHEDAAAIHYVTVDDKNVIIDIDSPADLASIGPIPDEDD